MAGIQGLEEEEGEFLFVCFRTLLCTRLFSSKGDPPVLPVITSQPSRGILEPKRNWCFCSVMVINSSILESSMAMILISHQVYQLTKIANIYKIHLLSILWTLHERSWARVD